MCEVVQIGQGFGASNEAALFYGHQILEPTETGQRFARNLQAFDVGKIL